MSTAYVKKSFVLAFRIAAGLVLAAVVVGSVFDLLTNLAPAGVIINPIYFGKEIGIFIALLIFVFLGYRALRVYRKADSPKREFIKMAPAIMVWVCIIGYVVNYFKSVDRTNCGNFNYNEKLNGGIKTVNGQKYIINLCGDGGSKSHLFGDELDKVRLEIFNEQGELLAKRYYSIFWDGVPGHDPIEIHPDHIVYSDDADEKDGRRTIAMPPSALDWIRARVPLLN